jgi:hypothetical protein
MIGYTTPGPRTRLPDVGIAASRPDDLGWSRSWGNFVDEWSKNYDVVAEFHSTGLDHDRLGIVYFTGWAPTGGPVLICNASRPTLDYRYDRSRQKRWIALVHSSGVLTSSPESFPAVGKLGDDGSLK